ncbi:MAG: MBL fold metallo-hydrolase [Clostridiales bacterium]|nr:MBL fold metallo-hydrolase [Clostridiales bacterium]
MMDVEIRSFTFGPVGANMYVLLFGKQALVIDPCCPWGNTGLSDDVRVTSVLCTHGHFDHISEADDIVPRFLCPLYISSEDSPMLSDASLNHSMHFGMMVRVDSPYKVLDKKVYSNEELGITDSGRFNMQVVPTPGHTSGSVCYYFNFIGNAKQYMFTGDMLFRRSIGRTDLGGSELDMTRSIELLKTMNDDIVCFPGHGSETILGEEKHRNPYF